MIGVRTEAGPEGNLIYWTRFGDLAAMVATVFGGSIVIELLRQWWGPVGTIRVVPPAVQSTLSLAGRLIAKTGHYLYLVRGGFGLSAVALVFAATMNVDVNTSLLIGCMFIYGGAAAVAGTANVASGNTGSAASQRA